MKRYFIIGLISIVVFALGIVAYGSYLNYQGENNINTRLANRILTLKGEPAKEYFMKPVLTIDTASLYSAQMTDAVARVEGMITETFVERNTHVQKGQALCKISNEDIPLKIMQAESNILRAEAEKKRYFNMYQRHSELLQQNATSKEKLDEAEAAYLSASSSVDEMKAQKQQLLVMQERQTMVSPIEGEVLMVYRQSGSYVQAGTAVYLIGDFKKLYLETAIEDKLIKRMATDDELKIVFNRHSFSKVYNTEYGKDNQGEKQDFKVRITGISPSMAEPAELRNVVWEIDNSSGLLEAQNYSRLTIYSGSGKNVLAVPLSAMADESNTMVFVVDENGCLKRRKITTGASDGEYIEVLAGLVSGEIVITSDQDGLEEGMKAAVELEGGGSNES